MARTRRFKVDSLQSAQAGSLLRLSADEAKHARVLRLKEGDAVELFDGRGCSALGAICDDATWTVTLSRVERADASGEKLILATAWPKGKRAATLVEKCAELGVHRIVPVIFERSVVEKDDESEGVERLRRIAAEAAKQSGRSDVPQIDASMNLDALLKEHQASASIALLDPRATQRLGAWYSSAKQEHEGRVVLIVGPEGGFSPDELALIDAQKIARVKIGPHILRVETAALAACALIAAEF